MRLTSFVLTGLLIGGLVAAPPASAQIGFGLVAGVSFAKFTGADANVGGISSGTRTGFVGGGVVDIPISDMFSVRPEVLYAQKGARFSDQGVTAGFNLDYIEIPALFVVSVPTSGNVTPEFFAGPQVSFRVGCSVTATGGNSPGGTVSCTDAGIEDEVATTDFGVIFGAGVTVGNFMAQAALDLGLSKIDNSASPDDIKNQAIYVMLGWMFR